MNYLRSSHIQVGVRRTLHAQINWIKMQRLKTLRRKSNTFGTPDFLETPQYCCSEWGGGSNFVSCFQNINRLTGIIHRKHRNYLLVKTDWWICKRQSTVLIIHNATEIQCMNAEGHLGNGWFGALLYSITVSHKKTEILPIFSLFILKF